MPWTEPEMQRIPVAGGELAVGRWGSGEQVVLASHGITANHRSFAEVAASLLAERTDVSLYAVDHRGRGGSARTPGPFGLEAHARDLLAVLDHLDVASAVLVGHSMGAYITAATAELAPERVRGLVLVDGALPIPMDLPPGTDIEEVVRSVIGPALDRLDATFASPEDYVAMWQGHPAVGGAYFTDVTEAYVRYDLIADGEGSWRSPVNKAAVLDDGRSTLEDELTRTALSRVTVPTTLLWAPRGMLDQEPGLFPAELIESIVPGLEHVDAHQVEDVNHYSIVLGERGANAVAGAISSYLD